jgi:TonB family protein
MKTNFFSIVRKTTFLGLWLTIFLSLTAPFVFAQSKLTLGDLFAGLRSKKATLEERNKLLSEAVKVRGVTFAVTPEIEKELEETGASPELIEAVKQKGVVVKPTPIPTPQATPTPAPTPVAPDFSTFQKKGDGNFVRGEYDQAVVNYTKAIDLNAKEPSIYMSRGLVYYNRKFYELAIADYQKVIEIDPKEQMAYFYRGDSYEKLGELQKAANDFKKVLEMDADNEVAKANIQRLETELNKNKAQIISVANKTQPTSEPVKNNDSTRSSPPVESSKPPEFAELGSLIGFTVRLVPPVYPQSARALQLSGEVTVNITIDEQGNPILVKAVSGPATLRGASEDAVRRSKFKPAMFNNQPIKGRGYITFKFKPS